MAGEDQDDQLSLQQLQEALRSEQRLLEDLGDLLETLRDAASAADQHDQYDAEGIWRVVEQRAFGDEGGTTREP